MLMNRRILGLAVTERSITAVEVGPVNGHYKAFHAARFDCPEEADFREPGKLGSALKQFLRAEGFSARRCVIGMEARWLTAQAKTLPPGSDDSLAGMLSISVEREFASDREDLVLDYVGPTDCDGGRQVLLVAAPRGHVEQLRAMAESAGLKVAAITSSTMTLARSTGGDEVHEQLVLHLSRSGAELAVRSKGAVRMLRRLSLPAGEGRPADPASDWVDDLAGQVRRAISPLGDDPTGGERELLIWNAAGLDEATLDALAERICPRARVCECPADLEAGELPGNLDAGEIAASACLGAIGLRGRAPGVDFLHSRLSPPRKARAGRKIAWTAAAAVIVAVACVLLLLDLRQRRREVGVMENQLKAMAPSVSEARDVIDKVASARTWYDRRPGHLRCLRELTLAFPEEGRIWTKSISIHEDMRVDFSGRAVNKAAVLEVLDRLRSAGAFSEIRQLDIHQSRKGSREVTFAISVNYVGPGGT